MYFEPSRNEIGDYIIEIRRFAYFPKKTFTKEWVWLKPYYQLTRENAYSHPRYRESDGMTIYLSEPDYLIFKLTEH